MRQWLANNLYTFVCAYAFVVFLLVLILLTEGCAEEWKEAIRNPWPRDPTSGNW